MSCPDILFARLKHQFKVGISSDYSVLSNSSCVFLSSFGSMCNITGISHVSTGNFRDFRDFREWKCVLIWFVKARIDCEKSFSMAGV